MRSELWHCQRLQNTGSVRGLAAIGGVCGLNETGGIIENSFNEGTVSGTGDNAQQVGGVSGYNNGTIKSCYNTASVSGQNSVGGVCGFNSRGIITNCFNEGTVSGQTLSAACAEMAVVLQQQIALMEALSADKVTSAACADMTITMMVH